MGGVVKPSLVVSSGAQEDGLHVCVKEIHTREVTVSHEGAVILKASGDAAYLTRETVAEMIRIVRRAHARPSGSLDLVR